MTLALDDETMREVKLHPEIRWSEVARQAIRRKIDELHALDVAFANSTLTQEDVDRLAKEASLRLYKRLRDTDPGA